MVESDGLNSNLYVYLLYMLYFQGVMELKRFKCFQNVEEKL